MFSELSNYLDESYAMEHQSCKFTVDEDVNGFDLFAVVTMEADEPVIDLECDSDSKSTPAAKPSVSADISSAAKPAPAKRETGNGGGIKIPDFLKRG